MSKTEGFLADLAGIVGNKACVTDPQALEPHVTEWRDVLHGRALAMASPGSTAEVAEVVKLCASAGVAIVPQGGNTGLCGGAIPDGDSMLDGGGDAGAGLRSGNSAQAATSNRRGIKKMRMVDPEFSAIETLYGIGYRYNEE